MSYIKPSIVICFFVYFEKIIFFYSKKFFFSIIVKNYLQSDKDSDVLN